MTKSNACFAFIIANIGVSAFIYQLFHFTLVVEGNFVSRGANFSYFTYLTLFSFSIWCYLLFISYIFKRKQLFKIVTSESLVCCIYANYLMTVIAYTSFQLISKGNFGLYNYLGNLDYVGFVVNLVIHYLLFICATYLYIKVITNGIFKKEHLILPSLFISFYFIIVKVIGMYVYKVEWYPYLIFDVKSFSSAFNIGNNLLKGKIILLLTNYLIYIFYLSLIVISGRIKFMIENSKKIKY